MLHRCLIPHFQLWNDSVLEHSSWFKYVDVAFYRLVITMIVCHFNQNGHCMLQICYNMLLTRNRVLWYWKFRKFQEVSLHNGKAVGTKQKQTRKSSEASYKGRACNRQYLRWYEAKTVCHLCLLCYFSIALRSEMKPNNNTSNSLWYVILRCTFRRCICWHGHEDGISVCALVIIHE